MFITKKNKLLKIINIVVISSAFTASAMAGGMTYQAHDGHNNNNRPMALPDNHNNNQYEESLLPQNSNYPEVGLRKKITKDCYCEGGYLSVGGGYVFPTDEFDANGIGRFDAGQKINGHIGAGYKFANFRVDVLGEYSYQKYSPNTVTTGAVEVGFDGTTSAYTGMMNAYYDFDIENSPISPYVGLGFGVEKVQTKFDLSLNVGGVTTNAALDYDKKISLVGAAMAGVAFRVSKEVTLDVGYRLKSIQSGLLNYQGSINKDGYNTAAGSVLINDQGIDALKGRSYMGNLNHEIKASLRYRF